MALVTGLAACGCALRTAETVAWTLRTRGHIVVSGARDPEPRLPTVDEGLVASGQGP